MIIWLDNDKREWAAFEVSVRKRVVTSCGEKGLWTTQDTRKQSVHCNHSLLVSWDPIQKSVISMGSYHL